MSEGRGRFDARVDAQRSVASDRTFRVATGTCVVLILAFLAVLLWEVVRGGIGVIRPSFLIESPTSDMTGGGIFPAIYGTVLLTLLMTVAVTPIGIATAIYLAEYAPRGSRMAGWVRVAVKNLAGVPSVVFGLFGLGFFVLFVGGSLDRVVGAETPLWGRPAVLWASLTLSVLTLPVVIVTAEEAMRAVPRDLREAAVGLGATRFQMILHVILPGARAGILTGLILAMSRGAGEVAPILFTGAANFLPRLPTDPRDMFMHLGYHVYALATQSPDVDAARPVLYGTVLVLLVLTFALNMTAIVLRSRLRAGDAR